ncbi:hypothetical protein [Azotobacter beijerinckii]|uniref:Uncharacterized protein n=1 Tax=Azotobacter beijerinckii TaxID=170623 RepID=A0A1I4GBM3_9GAMM|nr:hypothetical protein [Azotobacter beijerinckii]SFB46270.1 hypothetical protein SAMN04244571_02990 [Azotobacter beijerinckii]SFL26697.1 hypothetical protein SAMN04244574_03736 [Azotobacter beijerinckii]
MRGFRVPGGLSALVIARKLEQRFGLVGFARLFKLVELVADAATVPAPASAVLAWGDVLQGLGCGQDDTVEFLTYCEHAQVLDRASDDGRLRLTLRGDLAAMLIDPPAVSVPATPVLFTHEQQWIDWFLAEWSCPPYLAAEPSTRQLYRRWIASNVTVEEAEDASARVMAAREVPVPAVFHDHLMAVRKEKIERARA